MTSLFDKWNLRPGERRLVVVVAIVVFIVANILFVFPKFGEWGRNEQRISYARGKWKMFSDELSQVSSNEAKLKYLQGLGLSVGSDEQALAMQREVTSQAALDQVTILRQEPSRNPPGSRTNSFFEEQSLLITFSSGEKELVNFLFNLGARNSLIRVRSMQLARDPTGTRLQGSITFAESFQKKKPPKITAVGSTAAKPATSAPPAKAAATPKTNAPPKAAAPTPAKATPSTAPPAAKPGALRPAEKPKK